MADVESRALQRPLALFCIISIARDSLTGRTAIGYSIHRPTIQFSLPYEYKQRADWRADRNLSNKICRH